MSGNLPPGVSASDIDDAFGGPSHEHEWMPAEEENPILEDMAAIFTEYCDWVEITGSYTDDARDETYYETGAECDASRSYRFELAYVKVLSDDDVDLTLNRSVIDTIFEQNDGDENPVWDSIITAEIAHHHGDEEITVVSCDPDRDSGEFVVQYDGEFEIGYGPGVYGDQEI